MKNWIKRVLGVEELERQLKENQEEREHERLLNQAMLDTVKEQLSRKTETIQNLEQRIKEYEKPSEKELATAAREPYVSIVRVDVDPSQPGNGSFELDWNEYFVAKLVRNGYSGKSDEQIVDQWFQDVCRHVVLETYEQYEANNTVRVTRRDLGDGRSEIS